MAEYIERETLLDALGFEKKLIHTVRDNSTFGIILSTPAADVAPVVRWISAKKKLPKDYGNVLAVAYYHEKYQILVAWYNGNGSWFAATRRGEERVSVSHWMPLPEPPEMDLED